MFTTCCEILNTITPSPETNFKKYLIELTFRCYTCNIFRAIKVLQYVRKLYIKRNILYKGYARLIVGSIIEVRLALSEGLSLEMSKLSLNKSSKDEEQVERTEKSSGEIG